MSNVSLIDGHIDEKVGLGTMKDKKITDDRFTTKELCLISASLSCYLDNPYLPSDIRNDASDIRMKVKNIVKKIDR